MAAALQRLDVRRGRALLAFLERLVPRALDRAVMGEEILAAVIRRDEAKTLRIVEPLNCSCRHVRYFPESYAKLSELRWRARFRREGTTATRETARGGLGGSDFTT